MLGRLDRSAPKRHDAVPHVLVDGAAIRPNDPGQTGKHAIQQRLQLERFHLLRHLGKSSHVTEHHRHLPVGGLHAVTVWVLDHFIYKFGRHISTKQVGQLAFGPALHKIAITHVESERHAGHHQSAGQRQHQTVRKVEPGIQGAERSKHHHAQNDCARCGHQRQGKRQHQPGQRQHNDLVTNGVVRLDQDLSIQEPRYHIRVGFDSRIDLTHRSHSQVLQSGCRCTHQNDLVFQLAGRNRLGQEVRSRHISERPAVGAAEPPKRNQ